MGYQGAQGECHRVAKRRLGARRCSRHQLRVERQRRLNWPKTNLLYRVGYLVDRADHRRGADQGRRKRGKLRGSRL